MRLNNEQLRLLNAKGILTINANPNPITSPNLNTPFASPLTYIQQEAVQVLTAPRQFEKLGGELEKNGSWGQDSVSIKTREYAGQVTAYTSGNSAVMGGQKSDVNYGNEVRGVYYYEKPWSVEDKEVASAGFFNENLLSQEAEAAMLAIAIERNAVMFLGKPEKGSKVPVNGLLTDPAFSGTITTVTAGASTDTEWSSKTPEEIFNDIVAMINELNIKSKGNSTEAFNAGKKYNLGVANSAYGNLHRTNQYGLSVFQKLKEAYGDGINLVNVPEMDGFASGDNVAVLTIDAIDNIKTIKGSYVELARTFQVDRIGSVTSQKIASGISGCIVQRPLLTYMVKGI